jgi:hypothetical protein
MIRLSATSEKPFIWIERSGLPATIEAHLSACSHHFAKPVVTGDVIRLARASAEVGRPDDTRAEP